MIVLDTICELAKTLSTKVEKSESSVEVVNCSLKFSAVTIDRDTVDELLGMSIGWCRDHLFDEQGAPVRSFTLSVHGRALSVSGSIQGVKGEHVLSLLQAELSDVRLSLVNLGAVCEGKLTWAARGDEVEDVMLLLGKTCGVHWELRDAGQEDLFAGSQSAAAAATRGAIARIGRGQPQ